MTQRRLRNWLNTFHSRVAESSKASKKSSSNESWGTKGLKIKAVKHMDCRRLIEHDGLLCLNDLLYLTKGRKAGNWWSAIKQADLKNGNLDEANLHFPFGHFQGNKETQNSFLWNILLIRPNMSESWLMEPSVSACCLFLFSQSPLFVRSRSGVVVKNVQRQLKLHNGQKSLR